MYMEWQPIETAPKDGTRILGWLPDLDIQWEPSGYLDLSMTPAYIYIPGAAIIAWKTWHERWELDPAEDRENGPDEQTPTHWMPLPEAPV